LRGTKFGSALFRGLATHLPRSQVPGEHTQNLRFFLRELRDLCG
jgi:hypothetical protein